MIIVPADALIFVAGPNRMDILKEFDRFFAENKFPLSNVLKPRKDDER